VISMPDPPPMLAATPVRAPAPVVPSQPIDLPATHPPGADESPARPSATPSRRSRQASPGYVSVNATPWGAVFIDGRQVTGETPLYRHPLPPGRHKVEIVWPSPTRRSPPREILIRAGDHETLGFQE